MKAVRYAHYGEADVMHSEDVERPHPGVGQVLVHVAGTSFNQFDGALRAGFLQQNMPLELPHTPGIDLAGTVTELGDGVSGLEVGETVIGLLPLNADGAAADYALAPAEVLTAAPTSVPLADAAAIPAVALTAWQALFEHAQLQARQRILINGAGGGVGGFATQLAKHAGAFVIGTASPRSTDAVRAGGAHQIIDYTSTSVTTAVTEPVDVLLNLVIVKEQEMTALTALVRDGGVLVSTTSDTPGDPARGVRGVRMFVRSDAKNLAAIVAKVDADELRLDISERHPLSDIALVQREGADGLIRGKVVLTPEG